MLNNVSLVGRLTRDPELRYTNNNKATCSFSLAVEHDYADQNGNRSADFPNCVVWNKPAETFANLAHKGTMLSVTGRLSTRSYEDKNGNKVYVTEVIISSYSMIDGYGKGRQSNQPSNGNYRNRRNQSNQQFNNAPNQGNGGFTQNGNFGNNGNFNQQGNYVNPSTLPFNDGQPQGNYRG